MRAVILAGGRGRRLLPYTTVLPKPLMPVGDKPILEVIVRQLVSAGVERVTMAVGHLAGLIRAFFGDGERFGLRIDYSLEEQPLGTAGPLALIDDLDTPFLLMNGDLLCDLDYADLARVHAARGDLATVAAFRKEVPISLGVLEIGADDRVVGYTEKPTLYYPVSTGIYCMQPDVLRYIPKGQRLDLPDLILSLVAAGEGVGAYRFAGHWLDIGRPEDYERALELFASEPDSEWGPSWADAR